MPDDLVTLTINEQEVRVPQGTLLIEAAKRLGIEIPVFCYHPKMKPVGACRMCLVEIDKMRGPQASCTTPVAKGMVVHTESDLARGSQNAVIEFLLANHPLDCPICDRGGECPLQDNTFKYGRGISRFEEQKRRLGKAIPLSERIVLDRERCILCYRCVRFQDEIVGDGKLGVVDRGSMGVIGVLEGEPFDSPFSGNTIDICPVGALTSRQYRFRSRPWDLQRAPSVCIGCGMGCNIELDSREQQVQRMLPRENMSINNEWLCDRGRFDTLPGGYARLREAAVDGQPAARADALREAARRLRGGDVELVASPALTNEALNGLKALSARLAAPLGVWPRQVGTVRGGIVDLLRSKTIILVDFDVWNELPVLALRIREALKQGAKLYVAGSRVNGLARDTAGSFGSVAELIAAGLTLEGPISVLGPGAEALGAQFGAEGLVGSPATAANGAAMADLPEAAFQAATLLLVGNEAWPVFEGKQTISLRWSEPQPAPAGAAVLLPLAHPYEQGGTVTNFEGQVQQLRPGARSREADPADWVALKELDEALSGPGPSAVPPREAALA
ncbi:MAG: 2Fe-2S iron-sulfur cluster-binding protein [Chloroflexota bacterium]